MNVSTIRSLQQALLLCIGIAFLAPSLWFHLLRLDQDVSCQHQQHGPAASSLASSSASREALELNENAAIENTAAEASFSNDICGRSALLSTRSTFSLWMEHLPQILLNSRLRQDKHFQLHDLTLQVLQLYTPRLPLSVRTVTRHPKHALQALFEKTKARYDYLMQQHQQQTHGGKSKSKKSSTATSIPPPVVKIVVLGGSVTAGVNCISGVGNANLGLCAWPARLETLINGMVHEHIMIQPPPPKQQQSKLQPSLPLPLVQVHVFAIGGSNTQTATTLLEYDLLPTPAQNPDIIINAYSTNDVHVDTVKVATSRNATLADLVFDMMQNFVRVVLRPPRPRSSQSSSCPNQQQQSSPPPPVLLWLDDYLGNEQRLILETTAVSRAMHLLANYYGFASISYADAVRDVVYGDTHEHLFSPHWYKGFTKNKKKTNGGGGGGDNFAREIHPGQGMHMATAWTVAYNLLNLATHYCSQPPQQQQIVPPSSTAAVGGEEEEGVALAPWPGLPQLRRVKQIGGSIDNVKPRPTPDTLPPPLTDTLNLRRVSADWQESHQAFRQEQQNAAVENNHHNSTSPDAAHCANGDDKDDYKQCPFSWIVGLPINGRNIDLFHERESNAQDDMKEIHDYFVQHATRADLGGWQVQDDDSHRKKYGWVPPTPPQPQPPGGDETGADPKSTTLELEFWNLTQPIRTVTLFTMRSYGDKWANSTVKVVISTAVSAAAAAAESGRDEKVDWTTAVEKEMVGFHDKHTSEMYTEPVQLREPIQPGQGLKIAITLIRGTTFKIQGMAVCS
jgi:hypothetical protein